MNIQDIQKQINLLEGKIESINEINPFGVGAMEAEEASEKRDEYQEELDTLKLIIKNIDEFKKWINLNSKNAAQYDFDDLKWLVNHISDKIACNDSKSVDYELASYETNRKYTMTFSFI